MDVKNLLLYKKWKQKNAEILLLKCLNIQKVNQNI